MAQGKPAKKQASPPPPSPPPPQKSPEEDSSRASARASASEPVVADAGPEFNPDNGPSHEAPPPLEEPRPGAIIEWDEDAIAGLLGIKGRMLHAAVGAGDQDWEYTELDLAAIAPPLTRICNRYDPIRQYAGYGDPITIAVGVAGYVTRSMMERRYALEEQAPPPTEVPIPPADAADFVVPQHPPAPPAPTPPPAPPAPRLATDLPPQGTGSRTATTPPPPPPGAINAQELEWEKPVG